MLVIGLTGGIGSGKSTIAKLFAERGVPIIDTDLIARELTKPNQAAFSSIVKHMGQDILLADGTLNRAKLRDLVFADPKQRRWLENLLHPLIRKAMEKEINELDAPYCIAVIPLLFEVEFYSLVNRILVVDAPEALQIERVIARDKISKSDVQAILRTQASREDRVARAHDVILNEGKLEDVIPQVEKLHKMYLQMSQ
jgi:dephospho-CoA kinase